MSQTNVEDPQRILVSEGADEYTFPYTWTEVAGSDVTTLVVTTSLGDDEYPGETWAAPEILTNPATSQIRFQIKVTSAIEPGPYWTYIKIVTPDETIIRRCAPLVVA